MRAQQTELIYKDIVELHQEFRDKLNERHRIFSQENFQVIAKLEVIDGTVTITEKTKQAVIDEHTEYIDTETKKIVDEFDELSVNIQDFRERTGYTEYLSIVANQQNSAHGTYQLKIVIKHKLTRK